MLDCSFPDIGPTQIIEPSSFHNQIHHIHFRIYILDIQSSKLICSLSPVVLFNYLFCCYIALFLLFSFNLLLLAFAIRLLYSKKKYNRPLNSLLLLLHSEKNLFTYQYYPLALQTVYYYTSNGLLLSYCIMVH